MPLPFDCPRLFHILVEAVNYTATISREVEETSIEEEKRKEPRCPGLFVYLEIDEKRKRENEA